MKTATFFPAFILAALSSASPLALPNANEWHVNDGDESSPYNFQPMNANANSFWFNKGTASSCPKTVKSCPPGTSTSFRTISSTPGPLFLDSRVPAGGQQVYVARNGALKFLSPGKSLPKGVSSKGFYQGADGLLHYSTAKSDDVGFYACDTGDSQTFQVFVGIVSLDNNACGQVNLESQGAMTGFAAYQYA